MSGNMKEIRPMPFPNLASSNVEPVDAPLFRELRQTRAGKLDYVSERSKLQEDAEKSPGFMSFDDRTVHLMSSSRPVINKPVGKEAAEAVAGLAEFDHIDVAPLPARLRRRFLNSPNERVTFHYLTVVLLSITSVVGALISFMGALNLLNEAAILREYGVSYAARTNELLYRAASHGWLFLATGYAVTGAEAALAAAITIVFTCRAPDVFKDTGCKQGATATAVDLEDDKRSLHVRNVMRRWLSVWAEGTAWPHAYRQVSSALCELALSGVLFACYASLFARESNVASPGITCFTKTSPPRLITLTNLQTDVHQAAGVWTTFELFYAERLSNRYLCMLLYVVAIVRVAFVVGQAFLWDACNMIYICPFARCHSEIVSYKQEEASVKLFKDDAKTYAEFLVRTQPEAGQSGALDGTNSNIVGMDSDSTTAVNEQLGRQNALANIMKTTLVSFYYQGESRS